MEWYENRTEMERCIADLKQLLDGTDLPGGADKEPCRADRGGHCEAGS
jgi:hypothetical protein